MSKVARIYQGINEIQKYYQGGVLQRLFFDWKHYIGNELNIEYAKECAGRNIVISGKTYQNLFTGGEWVQKHLSGVSKSDRISNTLRIAIKPNTVYKLEILKDETSNILVGVDGFTGSTYNYQSFSLGWKDGEKVSFKITDTTITHVGIIVKRKDESDISITDSDVLSLNIKILEGDYTDIDLPTSIDGIEGAGEREFVKSKNLFDKNAIIQGKYQNFNQTTTNFNISDNANYCISGFIKIKPQANYIFSKQGGATSHEGGAFYDKNKKPIVTGGISGGVSSITSPENAYYMVLNFFKTKINTIIDTIQIEEGTTATEYEPFYEYYPVTIRNYNYKCKTDGIVLPNGVKNSIDTIDGKKVHTRRVGAVLLNGTQDMTLSNVNQTLTTRVRIQMNNAKVSKNNLICNWFIRTGVHGDHEYIIIQDSSGGICLFISVLNTKLSAPTVDGVRRYFNENPLWVFYEFTSPICTYLESGLYDEITIPASNIKNEIYLENEKWYHKRNIGKVIFDGSSDENWKYYNEGGIQRFNIIMPNEAKMYNVRTPVYAVDYRFEASKNEDKIIFISGAETVNKLYIYNYAYTSIEDFRAYLAENPLEVYYELAEPVETELYFTDITYKLNEPLRSLPNGVCDTIEENRLVQRVGKVVLDESNASNFKQVNTMQVFRWEYFFDTKEFVSGICDKFPIKNVESLINENKGIRLSGTSFSGIDIKFPNDTGFDINSFRTWLSENPVTVYYELATPIETEITPDMILINGEPITDTVGIELPDGTKDSIENGCYVKRVGKVIIDGKNGTYQRSGTSTSTLDVYVVRNLGIQIILKNMNTNYIYQCDSEIDMSKYITVGKWLNDSTSGSVVFKVPAEEYLWSDIHNAFLENPITLYVELATPVKIPLFSIKEGLTTLKSTNNITPQMELDCLVRDDFQNMCDNEWESGDINLGGANYDNINRIRLVNYIESKPNTIYRLDITNSVPILNTGLIGARFYDSSKKYLGNALAGNIKSSTYTFTTLEDCYYIRFIAETTNVNFKIYLKEVIN